MAMPIHTLELVKFSLLSISAVEIKVKLWNIRTADFSEIFLCETDNRRTSSKIESAKKLPVESIADSWSGFLFK